MKKGNWMGDLVLRVSHLGIEVVVVKGGRAVLESYYGSFSFTIQELTELLTRK